MSEPDFVSKEPIAIIGLGCVMPDAPDVKAFWDNLLAGKSSIREVPKERWDPDLYYSPDKSVPDTTYTKIGGFVTDDNFSGLDYRMPPKVVEQIDPSQRWVLSATRQAFIDAGYKTGLKGDEVGGREGDRRPLRDFDRNRCAIILGNAMGGELRMATSRRVYWPESAAAVKRSPAFMSLPQAQRDAILAESETDFKSAFIPVTEDTMPGSLSNVVAGRVANVFDLAGKNFTTDAACASSLAALDAAVQALQRKEADMVVWGGADRSMDVSSYIQFSKIGALSPDGSRPFDANANGFVMGEGAGIFLLKRLADAERDGDRIYAVVRGVGSSSDGKGKGITAPNPAGQVKAVLRAYEDAECDPATIGLLEAHGTSTPVGDPVELQSVQEAYAQLAKQPIPPGAIAVGSVKGNVGHLKAGAGAAGLLKAALALHHKVLPPSINVKTLNPRIDWARAPFKVQTAKEPWPQPKDHPRRAAVSSFGFGGTNFHVVLEEHVPGRLKVRSPAQRATESTESRETGSLVSVDSVAGRSQLDVPAFQAHMATAAPLEAEALVLDGAHAAEAAMKIAAARIDYASTGNGPRLRELLHPFTAAGVKANARVALSLADPSELAKKLEQAQKAMTNPAQARLAFQQGVFLGKGRPQGKVAFLFPGQGTQYVNMMRDLAAKYEVVRNTFHEADEVLMSELDGVKLTDILWPTPNTPEAQAASEKKLQLTEYTQPAVLAADVAMLRLLRQWGIEADVVAGHSLGEYGALVAAGVLTFPDALHAVAARGREMAHVEVPDLGKMASISGDWATVQSALAGMTEYVIPANKNCPSQTVIAGSSKGVDEAVKLLAAKGLQAQLLPVSAAFHSAIVAPASKPLRNVLSRLDVKAPRIRVLSNVGAQPYESDVEWIRDNLAKQVASPVEWIDIVNRMYDEGVRTFVEVGPKLALTNFVRDILGHAGRAGGPAADAVSIGANHPKKGGIVHVNELFAFLGAWGFEPKLPALDDPSVYTAQFRDPTASFRRATATNPPMAPSAQDRRSASSAASADGSGRDVRLDTLIQMAEDLRRLVEAERSNVPQPAAAVTAVDPQAIEAEVRCRLDAFGINLDDIGISGISVGLPGTKHALFGDDNWDRILRGENLIDPLPAGERSKIADKNIVRLVKGTDGSAQFQVISDIAQVIQLAGRRGGFDIADYGVGKELAESLDSTFQYAIAAGLEALHDAGIPLVRTYLQTSQGGHLPKEWKLPESLRDETGIIFASAFPGYDNLLRDVSRYLADKYQGRTRDDLNQLYNELIGMVQDQAARDRLQTAFDVEFARMGSDVAESGKARYEFNRKFLFNVLSMGHSQLAQLIGARGPNTQVNAACASTTQAIAIAEDWIRTGRCKRVLVVGADDVTSEAMFEWIGAGFLASGAATTESDVTKAALPFDKRRHGMIVGMGAVGLVLETTPECTRRGMRPIARLLASRVSNSAFHGSRLDVAHISGEMRALLDSASKKYGITAAGIAPTTVFMSHETYTPARGGSASAEVFALRATFGAGADQVVVANTKGFTGHPQGAGIEDAIVLKCLQRGKLPPIANYKEVDPELGALNLSKGGDYPNVRYALRLAAGFGSQVAMTLTELVAKEDERIADAPRYAAWLSEVSGLPNAKTEVQNRTLRIVDQGPPARKPKAEAKTVAPLPAPAPRATESTESRKPISPVSVDSVARPSAAADDVLPKLIDLVATKTGYPKELLDADLDMEADLGIDTVKQAELFGAIRDAYGLPQEDGIQIKDYPTLRKVAGYVQSRLGKSDMLHSAPPQPTTDTAREVAAQSPRPEATTSQGLPVAPSHSLDTQDVQHAPSGDVLARLIDLVAQKTGYPTDLLDPNLDMEADLGIDTVKQAELFGAIREAYSLPQEDGIQIKDYPTLAKVAGYIQSRLGGSVSAPTTAHPPMTPSAPMTQQPRPTPPATPSTTSASLDESAVLAKVTELVAAKTGYPADMLEPDLDMEADLGIDTVKQAELFGEVRTAYGIPMLDGLLIKDYPTLRKVAGFVLRFAPGAPTTGPATESTEATETVSPVSADSVARPGQAAASGIIRRAPTLRPQDLPGSGPDLPRGPVLVLGDAEGAWTGAIEEAGWTVVVPTNGQANGQSPVGLVVLALKPRHDLDLVGATFDAAKTHRATLAKGFVAVVTRQDGAHGLKSVRDPGMAALAGLGKALKKEFPDALVKVVDFHAEAPHAPATLVAELTRGERRTEVAYGHDGTRFVVEVSPQPLPAGVPEVEGKGIVVSGGAQGITVEMLAALAPQHPKLLLLGRTEVPAEAAEWAKLDAAGWKQMEAKVMEQLKAKGERVTPVSIAKALSPMQKAAEVHRNLHRLTDLGAEVLYAPIDVTNATSVAEAVAWAREQWGAVHGVIHAAGVEISKDIASKDRAQFDQVFGIKANGWKALMEATAKDKLEFLAAFGSVAGRFGNIGQTDYSAANEFLAKAVKHEAHRRKCNGFTIAWGPWGEVGMATKGSILQIMHASGVTPIPTTEGVAQFLAELGAPGIRESVVAGTLGAIDADGQVVERGWDMAVAVANELLKGHPARFRLLDEVVECVPEQRVAATMTIDAARDPGLADHKVDGVPYLPGVFGLEAFAEAASLLAPLDAVLVSAEDVKFASPLKQLKAAPVKALVSCETTGNGAIACRLTTQFIGPDGKPLGEPRLHFEARLRFGAARHAPRAPVPVCTHEMERGRIYPPFFHGPSFQVLESAGPLDGMQGVATYRAPTERHFGAGAGEWTSQPMLTEALFQVCGLRTMVADKVMALPAGIAKVEVHHHGPVADEVRLVGHATGKDAAGNRTFDVEAIARDGTVLVRLQGYAMVETGPAPAMPTRSNAATPALPQADLPLPQLDDVHVTAVPVESKPAERTWFTNPERQQYARFTVPKRADEWRAGRLAAKKAVMETHPGLGPLDVEVKADETTGRPRLIIQGEESALWLSISHRAGLAVAALSPGAVGVDLETIEDRERSFLEEAFNVAELKEMLEASDRGEDPRAFAACMWAAKEAALKRAGVGLKADLRAHRVVPDGAGGATVTGPTGTFGVKFYDANGLVLALSASAVDPKVAEPAR